jgi:hypothetical protein
MDLLKELEQADDVGDEDRQSEEAAREEGTQ